MVENAMLVIIIPVVRRMFIVMMMVMMLVRVRAVTVHMGVRVGVAGVDVIMPAGMMSQPGDRNRGHQQHRRDVRRDRHPISIRDGSPMREPEVAGLLEDVRYYFISAMA